jgi:hypothetical protein
MPRCCSPLFPASFSIRGATESRLLTNSNRPARRDGRGGAFATVREGRSIQVKPLINETKGMNRLITMKPTATPRNTIISGSIRAVSESVNTRTSSS